MEYIQNFPGSSGHHYLQLKHTSKYLKIQQWLFILNLKLLPENFQKFPDFQSRLDPHLLKCPVHSAPSQALRIKSDYFSLKSSISHLSAVPKASHSSMLEQYFHSCFSSSTSTLWKRFRTQNLNSHVLALENTV